MPKLELLSIALLDEPARAARTTIDDDGLNSLVVSIRQVGILEPLIVTPRAGGRFEVVAGHRRLLASRIAGLGELPCIVEADRDRLNAVKIHENLEREDLTPTDEAIFYAELAEELGDDTDAVAATVKRSRDHVEHRLNLLRGDKRVFQALAEGKIPIGVALELNKFLREDDRLFHLDYCVRTGASVGTARDWRVQANSRAELASQPPAELPAATSSPATSPAIPPGHAHAMAGAAPWELSSSRESRPCTCCGITLEEWRMLRKFFCVDCAEGALAAFLRAMRGEG